GGPGGGDDLDKQSRRRRHSPCRVGRPQPDHRRNARFSGHGSPADGACGHGVNKACRDGSRASSGESLNMKATASSLQATPTADKPLVVVLCDLVKARLTFLVLLTTLVGFYVGTRGAVD